MVYELCVEAGQFLARHNVRKFQSFAEEREEMRRTEEEAAARKERGQRTLRDIERQAFAAQVAERQRERQEEERRLEEDERRRISECLEETSDQSSVIVSATSRRRKRNQSNVEESELEPVETSLTIQGVKSSVVLGKLLGRNSLGQKTRVGFCVSSGRILAVSQWEFSLGLQRGKKIQFVDLSESNVSKQILSLEQEMHSLVKLKHPNLVPYYGFNSSQSSTSLDVFISQEFVAGVDISGYLSGNLVMELDMIRQLCGDLLSALSCLHGANLTNRGDIRDTSIFLTSRGTFRLADFCLDRRLRELLQEVNSLEVEDIFPPSVGRGGKKSDIYRLGILVFSLTTGSISPAQYPELPAGLSPVLRDFLQRCLTTAERERWTAEELLGHQFLRDPVQRPSQVVQERIKSRSPSPPPASSYLSASSQAQSRLRQDFEILSWLGRGGFGDVIKVKNKLDEKLYAIKRIRLNPADKATNRKIMREVKLLSRLNHENVVRYYNSWQEITTFPDETGHTETSEGPTESGEGEGEGATNYSSSLAGPSFRPPTRGSHGESGSLEWSVSYVPASTDSEGESDSEEEEELHGPTVREVENTNSFIVFDGSKRESEECEVTDSENLSSSVSSGCGQVRQFHNMYIQMEFCDKQTLRNCIDNNLYRDTAKVWRMFREIVEGLVHIHTQGMIHRDLKPVNIFIDSSDNVKIGDFGLATTGMINTREDVELSSGEAERNITIQEDLTGQIGTALYVAPELANSRVTTYNQKVDLYSLGIILFEMCYPPLNTGMERIQVLTKLRSAEVLLPSDWEEVGSPQQSYLLAWLLDHDPQQRPTSAELAQSDWLPPLLVEESTMQTLVRNAMKDTSSRAYKHLISAVIGQPMAAARYVDYDTETPRTSLRLAAAHKQVLKSCLTVVERHGALPVSSPHLLPSCKGEDWVYSATDNVVQVMTRSGDTVSLPYDLRVPFARYLARTRLAPIKRYCFGKVLREKKVFGLHPKELSECAFDIVTTDPARSSLAEAELLVMCEEMLGELGLLEQLNCKLHFRLSHSDLLTGVLEHFGVAPEARQRLVRALKTWESLPGRASGQPQLSARLAALGFPEQVSSALAPLLEAELDLSRLGSVLRLVTKRRGEAGEKVKAALNHLRQVETEARSLGLSLPTVFSVRNTALFMSGLVVQLVRLREAKSGRASLDILAAGGRYDGLVNTFSDSLRVSDPQPESELVPRAAGLSVSVDKLVTGLLKTEGFQLSSSQLVVAGDLLEAAKMCRELWSNNFRAQLERTARTDEAVEIARDSGADLVVMMASDSSALVSHLDKEGRSQERKLGAGEILPHLTTYFRKQNEELLTRQESQAPQDKPSSSAPVVNYNFDFLDRERFSLSKKKLEVRKSEKLASALAVLDSQTCVEVICVGYTEAVVRTMAAMLDLEDQERLLASAEELVKTYPRYRKEFRSLVDLISSLRFSPKCPVLVLFSLADNMFRIMC